ncbi:MAG TPA: hypothetical protein VMR52_03160 [Dehalococcoidia bacterium]|nr:hypothetical protein [Dehalococcoidia bacterium]
MITQDVSDKATETTRKMQWMNGIVRTISGANIARDTVENVEKADWRVEEVRPVWADIVKIILASMTA